MARIIASSTTAVSARLTMEAADTQPAPLNASGRETSRARSVRDGAVDAALHDLDLALHAAPEEELDVIAAARLPDIVRQDPHKAADS